MNPKRVIVAANNYLFSKGLECLINEHPDFQLVSMAENEAELIDKVDSTNADVIAIDLTSLELNASLFQKIKHLQPSVHFLAFNSIQPKNIISSMLGMGVTSYLLLCCDKQEITDALHKTTEGERFFCGQVLDMLVNSKNNVAPATCLVYSLCGGVSISERETEIVKLVSEGLSNQQIADKLFLSVHTINTHRKNIMSKLGITNTAGLVMYAVRSQLVAAE